MKIVLLFCGISLGLLTFVWFFYFVPLGCAMNTTGCREHFTIWSNAGLFHFWTPLTVAIFLIVSGMRR